MLITEHRCKFWLKLEDLSGTIIPQLPVQSQLWLFFAELLKKFLAANLNIHFYGQKRFNSKVEDYNLAEASKHECGERDYDVNFTASMQSAQIGFHWVVNIISQLFVVRRLYIGVKTIGRYHGTSEFDAWESITLVALWEECNML